MMSKNKTFTIMVDGTDTETFDDQAEAEIAAAEIKQEDRDLDVQIIDNDTNTPVWVNGVKSLKERNMSMNKRLIKRLLAENRALKMAASEKVMRQTQEPVEKKIDFTPVVIKGISRPYSNGEKIQMLKSQSKKYKFSG